MPKFSTKAVVLLRTNGLNAMALGQMCTALEIVPVTLLRSGDMFLDVDVAEKAVAWLKAHGVQEER